MKLKLPTKCVVDTNVPVVANDKGDFPDECVGACVDAIEQIMKSGVLVLDAGEEIFTEYIKNLSLSGQPGVGDEFIKWVHDRRWSGSSEFEMVEIRTNGSSYDEFPQSEILEKFDKSDKKFIVVANAHQEKPSILEATDSKWWGIKEELKKFGIKIIFMCPEYVKGIYREKMGNFRAT